jgi:hypothetical protein
MMRLILAPKFIEQINEKLSKFADEKTGENTLKITKRKMIHITWRPDSRTKISYIDRIKCLQGMETTTTSSHSLEDWRDLSLSLLSSLTP